MIIKRVVIADDAPFILETLEKILRHLGYIVVGQARDGIELLLEYKKFKPDIVMVDISMPKMNGIAALQEIRKHDRSTKVIMVSAMGEEEYVRAAIKAGANGFVLKPFEIETLVEILDGLIKTLPH